MRFNPKSSFSRTNLALFASTTEELLYSGCNLFLESNGTPNSLVLPVSEFFGRSSIIVMLLCAVFVGEEEELKMPKELKKLLPRLGFGSCGGVSWCVIS